MSEQVQDVKKVSAISAIKRFFEQGPSGRKVQISELKELSLNERLELGRLSAEALGLDLER